MSTLSDGKRREISDFLEKRFHINIDTYNEQQINELLIELRKKLDKEIAKKEQTCEVLEKQLDQEKMLFESLMYQKD